VTYVWTIMHTNIAEIPNWRQLHANLQKMRPGFAFPSMSILVVAGPRSCGHAQGITTSTSGRYSFAKNSWEVPIKGWQFTEQSLDDEHQPNTKAHGL
jgi:hypothetical protein